MTHEQRPAEYAQRRTLSRRLAAEQQCGLGHLGTQLQIAQRRRDVLAKTLGYAKDRYEAGYASYLEQIDAQRNLFQAEIDVINLRQSQLDNRIALYRALGGGWQDGAALAASK